LPSWHVMFCHDTRGAFDLDPSCQVELHQGTPKDSASMVA